MKTFKQHVLTEAFTRQHYVAIAKIIKTTLDQIETAADKSETHSTVFTDPVEKLAHSLADLFKDDNPRFDKGYFLNACGL